VLVFILPSFSGGGAERVMLNLLTELHAHGYHVGVIIFSHNGQLSSMLTNGIPVYNLNTNMLRRSILPLIRTIHMLKPKVVFSTFGYINVSLLAIRWAFPKNTKIWVREANIPSISLQNNDYPKLMKFLYRLLYKKADKVICTSKRMRDEFILDFSVSQSIIDVIPNPVDIDKIRLSASPIKRFYKGGVCYVASGRLTFQKGFDRLLSWFNELENKKSTLVILGDGGLKEELIIKVKLLNIQDRVRFLGFCNNPWQWYAGADAFLLPSRWEGMSNAALEALACGAPVIATHESGGIGELEKQVLPGSLNVVETEIQFIKSMKKVKLHKDIYLRSPLLPSSYYIDSVLQEMKGLLHDQ
jgi:glycosyltransferase involved in cell wall biosynthesis